MFSNLSRLAYEIVSFTSEDSMFPISELLKPKSKSRGWQSAQLGNFPQSIILKFICPVHINELQFLSHQSNISSCITVFTYIPDSPSAIPLIEQFQWENSGYLSLDSNEKTNYMAYEPKSLFIDINTLFLKISLDKCHANKYNIFNQVGLFSVNVLGEFLTDYFPSPQAELDTELDINPIITSKNKSNSPESKLRGEEIKKNHKNKGHERDKDLLFCPISHELMTEPVITPYGNCFQRKSIEAWLFTNGTCPLTKKKLTISQLNTCKKVKAIVERHIKSLKSK